MDVIPQRVGLGIYKQPPKVTLFGGSEETVFS